MLPEATPEQRKAQAVVDAVRRNAEAIKAGRYDRVPGRDLALIDERQLRIGFATLVLRDLANNVAYQIDAAGVITTSAE